MRRSQVIKELEKEYAEELKKKREEVSRFPLSQYSTSQLKEELRRRKRECIKSAP